MPRILVLVSTPGRALGRVGLKGVTKSWLKDQASGAVDEIPAAALFIMIGAEPGTDWLPREILRDERGYVLTGDEVMRQTDHSRAPLPLETSMAGVFAVGDVREGGMKRVASAVGEGSNAIRHIHTFLAAREREYSAEHEAAGEPMGGA